MWISLAKSGAKREFSRIECLFFFFLSGDIRIECVGYVKACVLLYLRALSIKFDGDSVLVHYHLFF